MELQVTLIGKNSMHKIVLPAVASGNYWLSDKNGNKEKKLINVDGSDGVWQISTNNFSKIIDLF